MTKSERTANISIRATSENWLTLTNIVVVQAAGPAGFAVNFDACGGTVSTATHTVAKGSAVGALPTATWSGHMFVGWFTAAAGGTQISASTKVTANVTYYAHWTANGGGSGTPTPTTVVVTIGDRKVSLMPGLVYGSAVADPAPRAGETFKGWFTEPDGKGTRVMFASIVPSTPVTLYAYWVKDADSYILYDRISGTVPAAAVTYDGYLCDANGNVKGTIQVKAGKPNAKTGLAAVSAVVVGIDGKKTKLKASDNGKAQIASDGPTTVSLEGGEACTVVLGADGMGGTYGAYEIDGARNVFTSKDSADKAAAAAVLAKWKGAVNVAWRADATERVPPYNTLSVSIANKGKVKVAGTLANGTKVSASGQLSVGEEWCCVPVVVSKKGVSERTCAL